MEYLIDTNVALWSLAAPEKLSKAVRVILENADNTIGFSSISVVEFELKRERLFSEYEGLKKHFANSLSELGFLAVSFSATDAEGLASIAPNRDPFDRMLAAQAISRNLTFLTKDKDLRSYKPLNSTW